MKKVLSLVMAFVLVFGLAACGSKPAEEKKETGTGTETKQEEKQ